MEISLSLAEELAGFYNAVKQRGAIGLLVGQSFGGGARQHVEEAGIKPLDIEDLIRIVELWDPAKQKIALESIRYYASHVEKNSVLTGRLRAFVKEVQSTNE